MPFKIVRNDITKMNVDAIVNTANPKVGYGSGVDLAVYKAAGEDELLEARRAIGEMKEGDVAITDGFQLPTKYCIHAVSPLYKDGTSGEEEKLRACYKKSMALAKEYGCKSLAFPLISTGAYRYPKEEAMRIAVDEIHAFLLTNQMLIYLVVFDNMATNLGLNIYPNLEAYIDYNYVCQKRGEEYHDQYFGTAARDIPDHSIGLYRKLVARVNAIHVRRDEICNDTKADASSERVRGSATFSMSSKTIGNSRDNDYDDFLKEKDGALERRMQHLSDTFQQYLFYLIEEKGISNVDVYKKAIITKRTFSKIKLNPDYHPDKSTAMRLCVGAQLNLDETKDLLARAGYALSPCDKRDIIFSYFIENKYYDMIEIDIALEEHGLPCFIE